MLTLCKQMPRTTTEEEEVLNEDKSFGEKLYTHYPNLNIIIVSILSWYILSMTISVYNRWMFSTEKLDFKFPIIITSFHQLLLTFLSIGTLTVFPQFRINNDATYTIPLGEYVRNILPCSIASAGDIGLGNTSFRFITLSLYTMIKTSSLIFVLMWGVLFKLEKLNWKIVVIVIVMIVGVLMMIKSGDGETNVGPVNYKFIGISLVLVSSCMSGLRWALTQIMLKHNKRTKNPILTMFYVSPGMFIFLLLVGVVVEGFGEFLHATVWTVKGTLGTIVLILIPGFLAFFMTIAEYMLLQNASLLTLSIAGIFKELLTIFVSWVVFGDKLSILNIFGLVVTFTDIICYNVYRYNENEEHVRNREFDMVDNEFVDLELDNVGSFLSVRNG